MENVFFFLLSSVFILLGIAVGVGLGKELAVRSGDILNRSYRQFTLQRGTGLHWTQNLLFLVAVFFIGLLSLQWLSTDQPYSLGTALAMIFMSFTMIGYCVIFRLLVLWRLRRLSPL
jgi:hypothetical protein